MYSEKDKKKIFGQAKNSIINDDNILFIDDIISEIQISKPTFYAWFPKGSKEYNEIFDLIIRNRIKVKKYIRLKLRVSGKAAELLALYRMICEEDERRAINQNYTEVSGKIENKIEIGFVGSDFAPTNDESEVDL